MQQKCASRARKEPEPETEGAANTTEREREEEGAANTTGGILYLRGEPLDVQVGQARAPPQLVHRLVRGALLLGLRSSIQASDSNDRCVSQEGVGSGSRGRKRSAQATQTAACLIARLTAFAQEWQKNRHENTHRGGLQLRVLRRQRVLLPLHALEHRQRVAHLPAAHSSIRPGQRHRHA